MRSIYTLFFLTLLCISCKNENTQKWPELELMGYGLPIKIQAPEGAEVKVDDLGIVKDVTIKGEDNYFIQILSGTAYSFDASALVAKQKADVQNIRYFSQIIEEFEDGFIFEKKFSEDRINYDFRCVKIQGDQEYVFQTGLMGQFTLEEVQELYKAVK